MPQRESLSPILARNLLVAGELQRLVRAFESARIPFVVLKGLPLLKRVYGRLDARPVTDNDLLVRASDVEAGLEILEGLGYRRVPPGALETFMGAEFHTCLVREHPKGWRALCDLHWTVFHPHLYPVREDLLWSRTEEYDLQTCRVQVFDPAMTILHLASHYAQHRFEQPRILQDLAAAWNRWASEVDDLEAIAPEAGLDHTVDFALSVTDDLGLLLVPPPRIGSRRARRLRRLIRKDALARGVGGPAALRRLLPLVLADPGNVAQWFSSVVLHPRAAGARLRSRFAHTRR